MDSSALPTAAPRNPPAKDPHQTDFQAGAKVRRRRVLATQNVSDVDYKILAQANTTFVGRFATAGRVEKVRHL